jgi:two-component system, response regulator PdtaR
MATTKKIMIVEDEKIIAMSYTAALKKAKFDVSEVLESGEEALSKLQFINPDLILMDIKLKGQIDGIDTASQILIKKYLPIIFMTGNNDTRTKERALSINSAGYLIKPINLSILITKIKELLNNGTKY